MGRFVVLLRGINVGGANRIAMADLRALLVEEGFTEVVTVLQSGNALVSGEETAAQVARRVEDGLVGRRGLAVGVVVRTAQEWFDLEEADPLRAVVSNDSRYLVAVCSERLPSTAVAELGEQDLGAEHVAVVAGEAYVWCPDGVIDSRGLRAVDRAARRAGVATVTTRNWNTVRRIADLL